MRDNKLILLVVSAFFMFACDSATKFNNPLDEHNKPSDQTDTEGETDNDGDKTDTMSENDDENQNRDDSDSGDSKPDNGDSTDDSDSTDTTPDNSDSASDNDAETDSGDSTPDNDADSSDTSSPDNDTTPANPCNPNPCSSVANSNGNCTASGSTNYSCGCKTHYTWNSSSKTCVADTQTVDCTGLPATGAVWNTVSSITQTWNGEYWEPSSVATHNNEASTQECRYRCKEHYTWTNSTCKADQQVKNCTEIPANAEWNTVSTITQTWNGSAWAPSTNTTYNETASSSECRFKCAENYTYENSQCVGAKRTKPCTGLPQNAVWNTAESIEQSWDGTSWVPTNTSSFNETPSSSECHFVCNSNYTWSESTSTCVANTQESDCIGLPNDAHWNTATRINQTWSGTEWLPTASGCYNETASTTECRFICDESYFWDSSECLNPCDAAPCDNFSYTTGECTPFSLNSYYCECRDGYYWHGKTDGCKTQKPTLGNICTSQNKCYNNSKEMVCPAEGEDFFGQDFQYAELGTCTPQMFKVETISGKNVVIDLNTGLMWQQTIPTSKYRWSNAGSYCSDLTYAGYDDWRLPTPQELLTIVDNSRYNPAIDTTYFPNTPSSQFWSSSTSSNTDFAWDVNFSSGGVGAPSKYNPFYVRCVR